MSRKIQHRNSNKKKIKGPSWKIVGRVTGNRVELVQVPIAKVTEEEDIVIQVLKGRSLEGFKPKKSSVNSSKKRSRPPKKKSAKPRVSRPQKGMLSDHTGSVALQSFQAAVREAKRR